MKRFYYLLPTLSNGEVQLRPEEECVNIQSYVATFPATSKKKFLRDSDRSYTTQPVQIIFIM